MDEAVRVERRVRREAVAVAVEVAVAEDSSNNHSGRLSGQRLDGASAVHREC